MKTVVITGSSRGIGYALALEFLKNGFAVLLSARNPQRLADAQANLEKQYRNAVLSKVCDVTNPEQLESLVNYSFESWPKVDIWINNAGIGQGLVPIVEMSDQNIDDLLTINLNAVIHASSKVYQKMRTQGSGKIFNMEGFGSDGRMMKNMTLYGTSKRALRYFTRSFSKENPIKGIQIGTISPGMVLTDLLLDSIVNDKPGAETNLKIFNILADEAQTVTAFLVPKMIKSRKKTPHYNWLNTRKIIWRFLRAPFYKRRIVEKYLSNNNQT